MTKKIVGAEYPLSKIFSSDFEFVIPSYQRPYAWGVDQATELFGDLFSFFQDDDEEGYFLGSIVLIKSEDKPFSEVIDGQQRLTTLTILLAAMANSHNDAYKDQLRPYIIEPGKELEGIKALPRLSLRDRDRQFFAKYVQGFALLELASIDPLSLDNESQRNIRLNAICLVKEIEDKFDHQDALKNFMMFLLTRCYLVAVSTPNQMSAFRVFSVMNSRGLDLQPTDIIKADMIGKITNQNDRQLYNEKWEELEVELSRSGFNDLFTYIRMIYAKEKAKKSLLEEFKAYVLPTNSDPKVFIDDVLEPFADALMDIRSESYEATKHAEDVNCYIGWLNKIDNSDWIPAAILFLKLHRNKPEKIARFFKLLERLVAYMHMCRLNVNERIWIYSHLIPEIQEGMEPDDMNWLDLDDDERKDFRNALDGNIYDMTPRRRNYLILRLDSFISDGGAVYDPVILTIEHVLPQTVAATGQWAEWWPDVEEQKAWVHRLANLVPLNKKKNSAAQNYEFKRKCTIYFSGIKEVSSYALTSQVINKDEWTPEAVKARQKKLLDILFDEWSLAED